jgi:hypothetical protein
MSKKLILLTLATILVAIVKRISLLDMNSLGLPFFRGQQSAQPLF